MRGQQLGCIHKLPSLIGPGATTPQLSGPPFPSTLPKLKNTPRREAKATLEPSFGGLQSGPEEVLAGLSTSLTLEANPNTCPGEQAGSWWVGGGAQGAPARGHASASKR